ncbi:hypothetical protein BT094_11830, partial [Corynebacterium diphtheriae]
LEDLGLLAAVAGFRRALFGAGGLLRRGGLLGRPLGLRRVRVALLRDVGSQSLNRLPDPGDRRLPVRELLDRLQIVERGDAREAVPG